MLLHGIPETADEVTDMLFIDTINSKLGLNIVRSSWFDPALCPKIDNKKDKSNVEM